MEEGLLRQKGHRGYSRPGSFSVDMVRETLRGSACIGKITDGRTNDKGMPIFRSGSLSSGVVRDII